MRPAHRLGQATGELTAAVRFLATLPFYLRNPLTPGQARVLLQRRLASRERDFLALARTVIFGPTDGLYRQLLRHAGCEYGDLERAVTRDGIEGALRTLLRHGVYLTIDELKGRRPVVRGSLTTVVEPRRLYQTRPGTRLSVQSSGSRGVATAVPLSLAMMREAAVDHCLYLDARRGLGWQHAVWSVPGASALIQLLVRWQAGAFPARWFSQLDPAGPGLHPRYRWSTRVLRWGGHLARPPLPPPVHVPVTEPLRIATWMAGVLRSGGIPHLAAFASSAVRICQAALDAGLDLHGAQFTLVGEPTTTARLAQLRRAGAVGVPHYASAETPGNLAVGCLAPTEPDELHVIHDLSAVIQAGDDGPSRLPANALLVSSVRPRVPLVLLNVSLGDGAVMRSRPCGCPYAKLGWTTLIHTVRSYEKLTAGGMTFLDIDLIRVLEEVLPRRFGGGPIDYQLVEDETPDGRPRLCLRVHPAVGPLRPPEVLDAFLTAIGAGSGVERVMGLAWGSAGLLELERRPPEYTAGGKILHLHVSRGQVR
jgi:hypothetical protein